MPAPASTDHDSPRSEGLAWSHELDLAQLLAAIGATQSGDPADEAAAAEEAAAMTAAAEAGTLPRDVTGVLADQLPPGPALAACLSGTDPAALSEWDLPGVASAFRRLAAWAQAGELAAVAEMASRTAARDDHVRVDADGRPERVTPAAGSTVGLELVMSHPAAMAWAGLGVTLRWRLRRDPRRAVRRHDRPVPGAADRRGDRPAGRRHRPRCGVGGAAEGGRADQRAAAGGAAPRGDRRGPGGRGAAA